jgi:hypothetical protein
MKKTVTVVLSLLLIVSLLPQINASASKPQGLDSCNVTDTLYNDNYTVYDLYDDSDTALDFSYDVPEGGAAVLIFFWTQCWNSRNLLTELSDSDLLENDKIKFTLFEINNSSKADTSSFIANTLGGRKDNVDVYYGGDCGYMIWSYADLAMGQASELSLPLVLIAGSVDGVRTILNYSEGYLGEDNLRFSLSQITDSVVNDITYVDTNIVLPDSEYVLREGDNTSYHGKEDIIIGLEGTFAEVDEEAKQAILQRVNEIRKEACDNGYPHPNNRSVPLTPSDYVPIKWSEMMEMIAAMRAAEASVCIGHQRLSAKESNIFFTGYDDAPFSTCEVLAWNWSSANANGIIYGINQFYEEKEDWLNDTPGAVTGHYTSMILPSNTYIGIAGFYNEYAYFRFSVAAQMSGDSGLDESTAGIGGKVYQMVKVDKRLVTDLTVKCGKTHLLPDETVTATAEANITKITSGYYQSSGRGPVISGVKWQSSDESVFTVDSHGVVTALMNGSATLTAYIDGGPSASVEITVRSATQGDVNDDGEVNNKDVVALFRYVSAGGAYEAAYDFNGDGDVNNKDVVALFRYVSD